MTAPLLDGENLKDWIRGHTESDLPSVKATPLAAWKPGSHGLSKR